MFYIRFFISSPPFLLPEIEEFLAFATSNGVRGIPISDAITINSEAIVPIVDKKSTRSNYVALDVDTDEGYIYYSEVRKDVIYRIQTDGTGLGLYPYIFISSMFGGICE